ncbi:hypothetical protein RB2501_13334 [Robiginitalea biformata HTCC2501]|uniref:BioF2-like acetyltransferase domain-containing protein n=2 Tax=Robiginitalea TaxID=252306 RepID=A4CKB4_ROBBH|nr:hypothetical protein RB2501_13334 [Robiginitalea biformata HTCC2501]
MIESINDRVAWKALLSKASCKDFYFTYEYHEISKTSHQEVILIHYAQENGCGVLMPLLIREIQGTPYRDATSVYGYAGPLWIGKFDDIDISRFHRELKAHLRELKVVTVFSRLHPFFLRQVKLLGGFGEIETKGQVVNIDVSASPQEQWRGVSKRFRTYLNKARRTYRIRRGLTEADLEIFMDLYRKSMNRLNATSFYFFEDAYFQGMYQSESFETDILIAEDPETGKSVSAAMFVSCDEIVQYHLSGTHPDYLELHPVKALIDEMRRRATEKGRRFFNLGGGLGSSEDSLLEFKTRFSKDLRWFRVWKYINDPEVYSELTENRLGRNCPDDPAVCKTFFPCYRCKLLEKD